MTQEGSPLQAGNPYDDFERIFSHFASAEELTGSKREEEEEAGQKDDEDMPDAPTKPSVKYPLITDTGRRL